MLLSGLGFVLAGIALGSLLFAGWEVCVLAGKAGAATVGKGHRPHADLTADVINL